MRSFWWSRQTLPASICLSDTQTQSAKVILQRADSLWAWLTRRLAMIVAERCHEILPTHDSITSVA